MEQNILKITLGKSEIQFAIIVFALAVLVTSSLPTPTLLAATTAPDRSKSAADIPLAPSASDKVVVTLITYEVVGQLADGVTYTYWTYNGTVPGPFIRLREGQAAEVHIKNASNSTMAHSIDCHCVLGTGGGSVFSQTPPGQETVFQFRAMRAGLYVYHCATPDIPTHIANGMYGLVLVEPAAGLPKVDREFYVVQGELYTQGRLGEPGHQAFDPQKAESETPEYVVFNGRVGALTGVGAMKAKVGETIRVFFGNAGPNLISSFHVIGGIFDRVYVEGAITSQPVQNVQTTAVPAGGSTMVEMKLVVPGKLTLVDHALFRIHRGAVGILEVAGPANPDVFSSIKNATTQVTPSQDTHSAQPTTPAGAPRKGAGGQVVSERAEVVIQNFAYSPAAITITQGTTVTWVNKDNVGHTVTAGKPTSATPPPQRPFDSSEESKGRTVLMEQGDRWSFTFNEPGVYEYYCVPHPYMVGKITVLAAPQGGLQGPIGQVDWNTLVLFLISQFMTIATIAVLVRRA